MDEQIWRRKIMGFGGMTSGEKGIFLHPLIELDGKHGVTE